MRPCPYLSFVHVIGLETLGRARAHPGHERDCLWRMMRPFRSAPPMPSLIGNSGSAGPEGRAGTFEAASRSCVRYAVDVQGPFTHLSVGRCGTRFDPMPRVLPHIIAGGPWTDSAGRMARRYPTCAPRGCAVDRPERSFYDADASEGPAPAFLGAAQSYGRTKVPFNALRGRATT